jgi:hypothetical protein
MSDRRREKELKRQRRNEEKSQRPAGPSVPTASAGRDVVQRELGDPARLMVHLRRLSELLAGVEELRVARIDSVKLVKALLALPADAFDSVPEAERPAKFRERLIPELVDDQLARQARHALDQVIAKAQAEGDRLALFAGRMFLDSWLRQKQNPHQNPAWEAIFGMSLLDALFEGHLLSRVVRDGWNVDEQQASKTFAKALAKAEVAADLEKIGAKDPADLAKHYVMLSRDHEKTYLLGFDALLHLVRANAEFATRYVNTIMASGATAEVRKAALETFDESYRDDVTKPLSDDLSGEIVRRIQALEKGDAKAGGPKPRSADDAEQEKKLARAAVASMKAVPINQNAFLKNTYLGSFDVYKNVAPVEEVPFIRKVWGDPTDRWALEEFEKFLLERRHVHRANRVRRYLVAVRKEAREKAEAEAAKGPTPG